MKISEISVGQMVAIGVNEGRSGVRHNGMYGRVLEVGVPADNYTTRKNAIRVVMTDEEGKERFYPTDEYTREELRGKPMHRIVPAREILDYEQVMRDREAAREAEIERLRRRALIDEFSEELDAIVVKKLQAGENEVAVHCYYNEETKRAEVRRITLSDNAAMSLAQYCDFFIFMPETEDDDEQEEENDDES